jgi:Kef-type K+ transport system membrane component KefB
MGLLDASTAHIILGAAVIDDILGLLVLAVVSSWRLVPRKTSETGV